MPSRCIELTAFGLAKRTRRSGSSRTTPSPTRWGVFELVVVLTEREAALGDHRREAVERRQVELLEVTEVATERRARLAGDDGHHRPAVTHRDALHVRPLARTEQRGVALDHLAGAERPRHERPRHLVDDRTDQVHRVDGLAGRGAHLGQHDRAAAVLPDHRREQQEVGEAEVGERLPRRREPLHVTQRLAPQRGLGARLLEERGHEGIVPAARAPCRGEERFADAGERARVGDVGRERGHADDDLGARWREPGELGAQLGFAPRDDLVVAERVGERAQHARGRAVGRRAPARRSAASSLRDRVAVASEHVGRALAVGREEVLGQHLVEHERAEVEAAAR